jgi:hypothetical protein
MSWRRQQETLLSTMPCPFRSISIRISCLILAVVTVICVVVGSTNYLRIIYKSLTHHLFIIDLFSLGLGKSACYASSRPFTECTLYKVQSTLDIPRYRLFGLGAGRLLWCLDYKVITGSLTTASSVAPITSYIRAPSSLPPRLSYIINYPFRPVSRSARHQHHTVFVLVINARCCATNAIKEIGAI